MHSPFLPSTYIVCDSHIHQRIVNHPQYRMSVVVSTIGCWCVKMVILATNVKSKNSSRPPFEKNGVQEQGVTEQESKVLVQSGVRS